MKEKIKKILEYSKNINVLYVEDDPENRKHTSIALSTIFDNIVVAIDGEDGLNKFKENKIDLVITDIEMPKLSGTKMIEEIKKLDKNCNIIFISAHDEREILLECMELQVDGFLLKPTGLEKILTLIEEIIKRRNISGICS